MTEPTLIRPWDWRYRVGFDSRLRSSVQGIIQRHANRAEAETLEEVLHVHASFVSFDALLDAALDSSINIDAALVDAVLERMLHVPARLEGTMRLKVADVSSRVGTPARELLDRLLAHALNTPYHSYHREIFAALFGPSLDDLLPAPVATGLGDHTIEPSPVMTAADVRPAITQFLVDIRDDAHCRALFGPLAIPEFDIVVQEGVGFAEYWPIELLENAASDLLIVYSNSDSMRVLDFRATLAHELVPGHGYFYRQMRDSRAPLRDYGAMALVEGWATWCEWHALPTAASRTARAQRLCALSLFGDEQAHLPNDVYAMSLRFGFSDALAMNSLLYYFQYPGFAYAYSLGALWFERLFRSVTPSEFVAYLQHRSWGDFFRLWNP